jgi:hypothetical protein
MSGAPFYGVYPELAESLPALRSFIEGGSIANGEVEWPQDRDFYAIFGDKSSALTTTC